MANEARNLARNAQFPQVVFVNEPKNLARNAQLPLVPTIIDAAVGSETTMVTAVTLVPQVAIFGPGVLITISGGA